MRVLILSDVHANPWALRAVEARAGTVDLILFAGDSVNYGPAPGPCVDWLRQQRVIGVRGNHDHAVAFALDPKASAAKEPLAFAMRDWTREQLDPVQTGWLLKLPRRLEYQAGGVKFVLVHGTPVDPLYDYRLQPDVSEQMLDALLDGVKADVLIVGHTHLPLHRLHGALHVVNPGSVGQPLDGDPRAAYALWTDGTLELKRAEYDRNELFQSIRLLPVAQYHIDDLIHTLERGRIDSSSV